MMAKRGSLKAGSAGSWSWHNSSTGEHSGSIGYRSTSAELVLDYAVNGQPRTQYVPILHSACNYGGKRPWFGCPRCRDRVAVLYMRGGAFTCRKCSRVAYYSQSEDAVGRTWRRQRKAEARLGEYWARPKGMHHKTRDRLMGIIFACEEERDNALVAYALAVGLLD
jgi:hypothetical protein